MPAALAVLYQRRHVNSKKLLVGVTLSGSYPGDPGEVLNLVGGSIPNASAKVVTGPSYDSTTPTLPPKIGAQSLGGWTATLKNTGTAGQYNLQFWNGTTQLTNIAYPAVISGGQLTLELEFDLGS